MTVAGPGGEKQLVKRSCAPGFKPMCEHMCVCVCVSVYVHEHVCVGVCVYVWEGVCV